jgi:hypothetical protein
LPSGAVRLVRLSALTESRILRTASLEFDIGFLLDVYFSFAATHAASDRVDLRSQSVFPAVANAGLRPPQHSLRPPIGSLWHLVCQKRTCQGATMCGSAENMGNLTFWHLVCQK